MLELEIPKEKLSEQLLPFRYNGALVFSIDLMLKDEPFFGLYGFKDNTIYLQNFEDLPDTLTIEIPSSTEEQLEFNELVDYFIHRLITQKYHKTGDLVLSFEDATKPLLEYLNNIRDNSEALRKIDRAI